MISLSVGVDHQANAVPAEKITGASYYAESGVCIVSYTGKSGEPLTHMVSGQDGSDLYNAMLAIQAGTYAFVEPAPPSEPEVEPEHTRFRSHHEKHKDEPHKGKK